MSFVLALLMAAGACAAETNPWIALVDRAEAVLARIDGYSVLYHKQERIDGTLEEEETMRFKFMKPFNVYLEWVNPGGEGGEAIYVAGMNKNRLRVHPGGFWKMLTFNLNPTGRIVMRHSRHPVTDIGLERLVSILRANVERGLAAGELATMQHPQVVLFGRRADVFEAELPADPAKGYYCRRCIVYVDTETGLPLNVRNYDWNNDVVEEYGYEAFRADVALTASDFDSKNPH